MHPVKIILGTLKKSHLSLAWNCDPTSNMPMTIPQIKTRSTNFHLAPHLPADTKPVHHMADGWENL
jgi:hypothetical protein